MYYRFLQQIFKVFVVVTLLTGVAIAESSIPVAMTSFNEVIEIQADGSAKVTTKITASTLDSGQLEIPWMFPNAQDLKATNNNRFAETEIVPRDGVHILVFKNVAPGEYQIDFIVPEFIDWEKAGPEEFKAFEWRYELRNSIPKAIENYSMEIVLPKGWNYHRVMGSMPPMKPKDTYPPYLFHKDENGLAHLVLNSSNLNLGDACWIDFSFKQSHSSTMLVVIGIILSILYLWFYRNILFESQKVAREQKKKNNK